MADKRKTKPGFTMYHDWRPWFNLMEGEVFTRALLDFSEDGVVPDFSGEPKADVMQQAFTFMSGRIAQDGVKYQQSCLLKSLRNKARYFIKDEQQRKAYIAMVEEAMESGEAYPSIDEFLTGKKADAGLSETPSNPDDCHYYTDAELERLIPDATWRAEYKGMMQKAKSSGKPCLSVEEYLTLAAKRR